MRKQRERIFMRNQKNTIVITFLIFLLLSITACGGGGGDTAGPVAPPTLSVTQDAGWSTITSTAIVNDVIHTGSKYIAVGNAGYIAESTDGTAWTEVESGTPYSLTNIIVLGTKVIANMNSGWPTGVLSSDDSGTTWTAYEFNSTGDCTNPASIFHDDTQFIGISNTGISSHQLCTSSNGASWTKVNDFGLNVIGGAYGGGQYVLFGNDGLLYSSSSLVTPANDWVLATIGSNNAFGDLIYANSTFVGIGADSFNTAIYYSADGANWSAATIPYTVDNHNHLSYSVTKGFVAWGLASSNNVYRIISDNVITSADGAIWATANAIAQPMTALANGTNETVAFGYSGRSLRSTDLSTWTTSNALQPAGTVVAQARNGADIYVATYEHYTDWIDGPVSNNNVWKSSDNGANWANVYTLANSPYDSANKIRDLIHDGTQLIMADSNNIMTSADGGGSWTTALNRGLPTSSVKIGATTYYVGASGSVLSSTDGISFSSLATLTTQNLIHVASDGTGLVAISADGTLVRFDGTNWSTPTLGANTGITDIVWNGSVYVVVGNAAKVFTSVDGVTWTAQTHVLAGNITDILSNGTLLVTAGSDGLATSTDNGMTWFDRTPATVAPVAKYLAFDGTSYFGFTDTTYTLNTTNYTSADALTWTTNTFVASNPITISGFTMYDSTNTRFVRYLTDTTTGATYGQILASADGQTWDWSATLPTDLSFSYISANNAISTNANASNTLFYSGATVGSLSFGVAYSADGANWTLETDQSYNPGYTPTSGVYARRTDGAVIETSTDGLTWATATPVGMDGVSRINGMGYINGQYLASVELDYNGFYHFSAVYKSDDATNWSLQAELPYDLLSPTSIRYDGINYLFIAQNYNTNVMIYQSTDLLNFTLYDTGIKEKFANVKVDSTGYTVIGENASVATRAVY